MRLLNSAAADGLDMRARGLPTGASDGSAADGHNVDVLRCLDGVLDAFAGSAHGGDRGDNVGLCVLYSLS